MRAIGISIAVLVSVALTVGCPPRGAVPPVIAANLPDGETPCEAACEHLTGIGCPQLDDCATTMAQAESDRTLAASASPTGSLSCLDIFANVHTLADVPSHGASCSDGGP